MNDELPRIIAGIEMHLRPVKDALASGKTDGLSRLVWELGTMCSLSGKALKDMSVEMERAETHTKAQGHQEMPPSKAMEQVAGGREQQPSLFG